MHTAHARLHASNTLMCLLQLCECISVDSLVWMISKRQKYMSEQDNERITSDQIYWSKSAGLLGAHVRLWLTVQGRT